MANIKKRVVIEPLLFGEYYVAVYDEHDEMLLDNKKYYCANISSATFTAAKLAEKGDLGIFICDIEGKEKDITNKVDVFLDRIANAISGLK